MVAQAHGHDRPTTPIGAPPVLQFEPHQPEVCGFVPDLLLDVTRRLRPQAQGDAGHAAPRATSCGYYTELGTRRGVQAVRNGARRGLVTHAEAFRRTFPTVAGRLW